jgi:glycosyltransferase involved in cell wall biosynthesis
MHIGIDCRYVRAHPSGIGVYVEEMARRIPVLAPDNSFTLWRHREMTQIVPLTQNVTEQELLGEPNALWSLQWPKRYMSFDSLDVYHAPHNTLPRGVPCPSVVTLHDIGAIERPDLEFTHWREWPRKLYYASAQRRALTKAARLITTTKAMAGAVARVSPGAMDRLRVIPLAAREVFHQQVEEQPAIDLLGFDSPYFLVVGQFSPSKQQHLAVEAFARSSACLHKLVLLQRQTRKHPLLRLAKALGVEKRVVWLSHVELRELASLFRRATALIQPSIYEGFGLPIIEAMSCGCPVIVSDLPALREIVASAGILVPPSDVRGFAGAMSRLSSCPGYQQELAAAAVERSRDFSWDQCARQTLEVYREAAGAS